VAVHVYTQTIHRTTQITTEQHKYKLMWKSAGRAPFSTLVCICLSVMWVAYATHITLKPIPTLPRQRQVAVTVRQIPDAVDIVVCAPDDG